MKRDLLDTPVRLAALTGAGGLISALGFISSAASERSPGVLPLLGCFALVIVGMFFLYWSSYTLREGIRNDRWPAADTDPLRRLVGHSLWTAGTVLLILALVAELFLKRRTHSVLFWSTFVPLQAMTQLSGAFRAPKSRSNRTAARLDWTKVAPLSSEHWGQR